MSAPLTDLIRQNAEAWDAYRAAPSEEGASDLRQAADTALDRLVAAKVHTIAELAAKAEALRCGDEDAYPLFDRAILATVIADAKDLAERRAQADQQFAAKVTAYYAAKADFAAGGFTDQAHDEWIAAGETVLRTPAPDLAALSEKARVGLDIAHTEDEGDTPDNPAFIARLLNHRHLDEGPVVASLFVDLLRLAGDAGPITTLTRGAGDVRP